MHRNTKKNTILVLETIAVFVGTSWMAVSLERSNWQPFLKWILYAPLLIFQGFWFYRFYIIGHEAAHGKLFAKSKILNDIIGTFLLLPLMTPLNIYRKIHAFHHSYNRMNNHTSALDTFTTTRLTPLKKYCYHILWFVSIFLGGFFIHSLVSVFLFLFIPSGIARGISPAFEGWRIKDQIISILLFSLGVGFHFLIYHTFGWPIYLLILGFPMLSFAWILSMFVYIFHYGTTIGEQVRFNVRSIPQTPIFSWILMNFNQHATHHQFPNIPWYDLPQKQKALPAAFAEKNQTVDNLVSAVCQQIKGPNIVIKKD